MTLNICHFAGFLGRDPELRFTPGGKAVADFSLGITRKYGEAPNRKEETTWINCVAWDRSAETIAQYCFKGSNLFVTGYLKQEQWTDNNTGQRRQAYKLSVSSFQFISSPQQAGQQGTQQIAPAQQEYASQQHQEQPSPANAGVDPDAFGDDSQIPF